jgi:two-component system nitrate/nitrite response regulator NarL
MTEPGRLLIADYGPTRMGVRIALAGTVAICAEASDADEAIRAAERERPDICIVGLEIPGGGIEAIKGIVKVAPMTSVIVLAASNNSTELLACVRAGAVGFVPGSFDGAQLQRVVRAVLADEAAVPRSMVRELVLELRNSIAPGADGLSSRETQVLNMVRRGHTTAVIARELEISPVTVRRHISMLVTKLGVAGRVSLLSTDAGA